jgi:hypothetical protein
MRPRYDQPSEGVPCSPEHHGTRRALIHFFGEAPQ